MQTLKIKIANMQTPESQVHVCSLVNQISGAKVVAVRPGEMEVALPEKYMQDDVLVMIEKAGYAVLSPEVFVSTGKDLKLYTFKTNINCSGCVSKVTPFLNALPGAFHWEVDTATREKILTVKTQLHTQTDIMDVVRKAGFQIEAL
jgi:copper chaperone